MPKPSEKSTETTENQQVTANIGDIADTMFSLEPTPDVSPETDAAGPDADAAGPGAVDRQGNAFDPAVHKVGPDGKPKLTKRGYLCRKPGRKPGTTADTTPTPSGPSVGANAPVEADYRLSARVLVGSLVGMHVMAISDEFAVDNAEREQLESAFENYLRAKGISDIPPGVALALVMSSYYGSRIRRPKTQSKLVGIAKWFARLRAKFEWKKTPEPLKPSQKQETQNND
jgi:hypothetical protein